jgi:hypothetical protein
MKLFFTIVAANITAAIVIGTAIGLIYFAWALNH